MHEPNNAHMHCCFNVSASLQPQILLSGTALLINAYHQVLSFGTCFHLTYAVVIVAGFTV